MMNRQQVFRTTLLGILISAVLATASWAINEANVVQFSIENPTGTVPLTVEFQNETQTPRFGPVSFHWDFGDGSVSALENPVHTYTVPGEYDVSLTISFGIGVASNTKADAVKAHDVLMMANFDDATTFVDQWDTARGPVGWTNNPALHGSGSIAFDILFLNGLSDPQPMNGDDGMVVAGGGSGQGCPDPSLPCRGLIQHESYGRFSFRFTLSQLVASDGSDFSIFQLFENDEDGTSLVQVKVYKDQGQFSLGYVLGSGQSGLTTAPTSISPGNIYQLDMTWISGRATRVGSGMFHAALKPVGLGSAKILNSSVQEVSVFNLDNFDHGFDTWRLGLFDSYFPHGGSGRFVADSFIVRRSVATQFQNDLKN